MAADLNDPQQRAAILEHEKHVLRIKAEAKRTVVAEQSGATAPPEILSLRERLTQPPRPTVWRIEGLQGDGHRVLLAAQFKAGKTTLGANVVRSVLDGDPFLGSYKTTAIQGSVGLFDFEMSPNQLDDWYRAQRIANDDRLFVIPMRGAASSFNILDPATRAEWVTRLRSRNVKYLILDCLRPVLDALGLNEHTEAGSFLTAFDALLREAETPEALVIQHMGHKGERARGDSRLLDWPDVGWTLVRESEDDPASARFFKAFGRDVDVPETQLAYDHVTRRLTVEGGSRAEAGVSAALQAVFQFVASATTPPSSRGIQEAFKGHPDYTQQNIRGAIHEGVRQGVLVQGPGKNGGYAYRISSTPVEAGLLDSVAAVSGGQPR